MTIVVDANIPFAREIFSAFGDVRLMAGRAITREDLLGADALIVRSVTRVDASLLSGTPVRFVGTATIGVDHIDTDYLRRSSIAFADAAGSNARSVAEYVVAALLELRRRGLLHIEGASLGVVGVGNVGSIVTAMARALGMNVIEYDPPRAERDSSFTSAGFDDLLHGDVITLHVPLTKTGPHATLHWFDSDLLARLRPETILINTSRGGVVQSTALAAALMSKRLRAAVLDVWEEEPDIPAKLIESCAIATPHIAGYSFDGKVRGTEMIASALAEFAGRECEQTELIPPHAGELSLPSGLSLLDTVHGAVSGAYDIMRDDADIRTLAGGIEEERRNGFDRLRRDYRQRREFPAWGVQADDAAVIETLHRLRFNTPLRSSGSSLAVPYSSPG
jgi:erythronate-4-phosphate dehydrogenase